jgi:hypothetical protein
MQGLHILYGKHVTFVGWQTCLSREICIQLYIASRDSSIGDATPCGLAGSYRRSGERVASIVSVKYFNVSTTCKITVDIWTLALSAVIMMAGIWVLVGTAVCSSLPHPGVGMMCRNCATEWHCSVPSCRKCSRPFSCKLLLPERVPWH